MIQFLDALAIFFVIIMGTVGFQRGLIEELGRLLGLIISTIFSLQLYISLGSYLTSWIEIDPWLLFVMSYIIIFSTILLITRIITRLIHFLFLSKSTNWVNRIMGVIFGATKGILVLMIFYWIFELIPNQETINIMKQKSKISNQLIHIRKTIVLTFNFEDPIKKGEKTIQKFLNSMEKLSD